MPNFVQAKEPKNKSNPLIILFHGLANHATSFSTMQEALSDAFPAASVVAVTSMEGMQSVNLSIKEQARETLKELASSVKDLENKPLLLIGHSQGGLRAYSFLTQFKALLDIKGLVTLAAPWEGAPGARVDLNMLRKHLTDAVLQDLRKLSLTFHYPDTKLEGQLKQQVQTNQYMCLLPGAKDLIQGSPFLKDVKESLPTQTIPILAIGGGQSDFGALVTKKKFHSFKALNNMYNFFVAGQTNCNTYHDMQLPLYSQHAHNIIATKKKTFQRIFIKDAFHSSHVLAIPVPKSKNILEHPRVLQAVIKFTKNIFK